MYAIPFDKIASYRMQCINAGSQSHEELYKKARREQHKGHAHLAEKRSQLDSNKHNTTTFAYIKNEEVTNKKIL